MSASTKAMLSGLLLAGLLSTGAALPATAATLFSTDAGRADTCIWISSVTPVIFGEDSTNYDYCLFSSPATAAQQAVHAYSQAVASGNEDNIVTTFLNATQGGTLTSDKAGDAEWKCSELSSVMSAAVSSCRNVQSTQKRSVEENDNKLVARSQYTWHTSTNHVSSGSAVDALAGALGRNPGYTFPTSPRSYCIYAANVQACFSWSKPQSGFTQGSAEHFISDAQSVVGFNTYSAQAKGVLGGGDVCISNRATGCT